LEATGSETIYCLEISCESRHTWKKLNTGHWERFCRTIQECLPCIRALHISYAMHLSDHQWACLFKHMPSQVSKLLIQNVGDLPLTFRQIGISLPRLQHVTMAGPPITGKDSYRLHTVTLTSCHILATSLEQLTLLRKVYLDMVLTESKECWGPVLKTIGKNPNLEEVMFNEGWRRRNDGILMTSVTDRRVLEDLQFGPRLQEAKRLHLSLPAAGDSKHARFTLEQLVEALISVRDRIDCLDYLIREMDPSLFATVVGNAESVGNSIRIRKRSKRDEATAES